VRCITLHAHWAEAIFTLGKDVENRSWKTSYRGPLLIHAGSKINLNICTTLGLNPNIVRRGQILGVVELVDCVTSSPSLWAIPGYYHWILRMPCSFVSPIPMAGQLGLYTPSMDICAHVSAATCQLC
jgi:hypothetical protein